MISPDLMTTWPKAMCGRSWVSEIASGRSATWTSTLTCKVERSPRNGARKLSFPSIYHLTFMSADFPLSLLVPELDYL